MCNKANTSRSIISIANLSYKQHKSYIISKNSVKFDLSNLNKRINADFPPVISISDTSCVVYIYSLVNKSFKYPKGKSKILYIGNTISEKHNGKYELSFRFRHCKEGHDSNSNDCLRFYYEHGTKLLLEIYEVDADCVKQNEQDLRNAFLMQFKSLPIADGASYSSKRG